jgi:hypothetical protein
MLHTWKPDGTGPFSKRYTASRTLMEASMAVILVPILWVAGGIVVLGGGYYVITQLVH